VSPIPYNNLTSRTDAAALIPEEVSTEMLRRATDESAVLRLFRRVPVGRAQVRFPVLSALPVGYFVNGDTGLKQTTEVNWTNKYLNIEEIATILPVPDNVVADVDVNIWDEAMPYLVEAFYRTFDAAVFFGTNAPGTWPTNVSAAALAAGNSLTGNAAATAGGGYGDLDAAYALLDADGYDPTGIVAATTWKGRIRPARDSTGQRLDPGRANATLSDIDGLPVVYPMRGLWPAGSGGPYALVGDWSQFVVGVRQDITMKILDQAVITDNTGAIIYNLPQQDMTAIRLTFRVGWQVANILNYDQPTEGSRYPVARILIP
jgi:HK97 family phage major capsid protein